MGSVERDTRTDFDMIIVGAGISGINTAYRVQNQLPNYSYTILESRGDVGGTWDLFRYPGIRSDSELQTFGFSWRPWMADRLYANGEAIQNYVRESAREQGIHKKIQFHHRLLSADWSTDNQRWSLLVDADGEKMRYSAKFLVLGTGYYDYQEPLKTHIPGLENFSGQVIHPQFWPEDLDYAGKKIVVIGSGATAVTLIPNLVDKAAKVTMLQRSPSYVMALPAVDKTAIFMRKYIPWLGVRLVRWKYIVMPYLFFLFCRSFPNAGRNIIRKATLKQLPKEISHDPNFQPRYNPWEQRLCISPDGDFFAALRSGKADIVTDSIKTVTSNGITTENGTPLDADIIITATGLKMQLAGGAAISVDGTRIDYSSKFIWKSAMLQDVPNAAFIIGYTNASWTLGADTAATLICRLCKHLEAEKMGSAIPRLQNGGKGMKECTMLNLNSTYIEKAKGELPKAGDKAPWMPRQSYVQDSWVSSFSSLTEGLEFEKLAVR